jgi:ribonuclease E
VESKKRRRRGGRGRKKELTAAEQEEQLRELAEEAAKGVGARPALGISTSAEAEAEDADTRAHIATTPPLATVTPLHSVPDYAAVDESGEGRAYASYGGQADGEGRRRRRRRRRRRGPGDAAVAGTPALTAVPGRVAPAPDATADGEGDEEETAATPGQAVVGEDGVVRKRRRRRRRRGRGGAAGTDVAASAQADGEVVPERHIFRVNGAGATERTGTIAPPQPSRAIARFDRKAAPPAVEAPAAILTLPPVDAVAKVAKRAPRGRKADDLEVAGQLALPAPVAEAPKRRGRPPKAAVPAVAAEPAVAEAKPKRTRKTEVAGSAVEVAPARATAARGRPAKAAAAEAAPVKAAAKAKKSVATKATGAKKSTATKKSTSAKKSTTTRLKKSAT